MRKLFAAAYHAAPIAFVGAAFGWLIFQMATGATLTDLMRGW